MKNVLKIKRWEHGIKQYELAILLGCSSTYLSMVENSRIEPSETFKEKVAEIFHLDIEQIFEPENKNNNIKMPACLC
ncbi:XRE family transcriptional regulator [candidate division KSB1 bacterium]|nr:helix-turn-helix transcriptional regulator [candidate division KSB1 bacterium]RQW01548.1 MAG: XRE family transcriptional regulator [candidate division KSB1 bacterium]